MAPRVIGTAPQRTTSRPPTRGKPQPGPLPGAPNTPPGHFRLWRVGDMYDPKWSLWCLLGGERPKPVRGYGGWGQTARGGRRAVSTFEGSELPAVSVAVLLDREHVTNQSLETKFRNLERLAGWEAADDDPPPLVGWTANVPHDYAHTPKTRWVVESLEWGDSNASNGGRLLWIEATIVLGLHRSTEIRTTAAKGFRRATLTRGHDLRQFARRHLGDPKRWRDVAELNRDNPKCPQTPTATRERDVVLLLPPREG